MNFLKIAILGIAAALWQGAQADYLAPYGFDFAEPAIGAESDAPSQTGLIVFDQVANKFKGRHNLPWVGLTNSVSAASTGVVAITSARVAHTAGVPAAVNQDGSWITSAIDNGTKDVALNIASGTFSGTPKCNCTLQTTSALTDINKVCAINGPTTSTSVRTVTEDSSSNNPYDMDYMIIYMGPK